MVHEGFLARGAVVAASDSGSQVTVSPQRSVYSCGSLGQFQQPKLQQYNSYVRRLFKSLDTHTAASASCGFLHIVVVEGFGETAYPKMF